MKTYGWPSIQRDSEILRQRINRELLLRDLRARLEAIFEPCPEEYVRRSPYLLDAFSLPPGESSGGAA